MFFYDAFVLSFFWMVCMRLSVDGKEFEVDLKKIGSKYLVEVEGKRLDVDSKNSPVCVNGKLHDAFIAKSGEHFGVQVDDDFYDVSLLSAKQESDDKIVAPIKGTVSTVRVALGDRVSKGDVLVTILSMKMENEIRASRSCKVGTINIKKGQVVEKGELIMELL